MKKKLLIFVLFFLNIASAEEKLKFEFKNEEINTILEFYSKATGQKFVIDSTVRGKITLLNKSTLSAEESFDQISEALALNGYAIIKKDDVMTVKNARSAQHDSIETSSQLPKTKPQRMATWIVNLKYAIAADVVRDIRVLSSSYGDVTIYSKNNQLIITDWTSNLLKISEIIKIIDVAEDPQSSKLRNNTSNKK